MPNEPLPHPTLPTPDFAPRQRDDGAKGGNRNDAQRMIAAVERMDAAGRSALPEPSFPTAKNTSEGTVDEPVPAPSPANPERAVQQEQVQPEERPADSERVPTVSGVVSRLGRAGKFLAALTDKPEPPRSRAGAPSFTLLERLVGELAAAVPPTPPPTPLPVPPAPASLLEDAPAPAEAVPLDATLPEAATAGAAASQPTPVEAATAEPAPVTIDAVDTTEPAEALALPAPKADAPQAEAAPAEPLTLPPMQVAAASQFAPLATETLVLPAPSAAAAFASAEPAIGNQPSSVAAEPPAPTPPNGIPQEQELLSSFARMGANPHLPPEIGQAVIFEPRSLEPDQFFETDWAAEPFRAPDAEPTTPDERIEIAVRETVTVLPEPSLVMVETSAVSVVTVRQQPPRPPEPPKPAGKAEPSALDHDPAEFLLEPAASGSAPMDASLGMPDNSLALPGQVFAQPMAAPLRAAPIAAATAAPVAIAPPKPRPRPVPLAPTGPADPLAPLKAMSDEEKIALFS